MGKCSPPKNLGEDEPKPRKNDTKARIRFVFRWKNHQGAVSFKMPPLPIVTKWDSTKKPIQMALQMGFAKIISPQNQWSGVGPFLSPQVFGLCPHFVEPHPNQWDFQGPPRTIPVRASHTSHSHQLESLKIWVPLVWVPLTITHRLHVWYICLLIYHKKSTKCRQILQPHGAFG